MKKSGHLLSFCGGLITAVVIIGCITTALAASGLVSFGAVNLKLNGETVFSKGDSLHATAGDSIPSSILYTDESGGGTTYLPMRTMADLLDVPIAWDSATDTVLLGQGAVGGTVTVVTPGNEGCDLDSLPLECAGSKVAPFTEVTPEKRDTGIFLLEETEYCSASNFKRELSFNWQNGRYVSVTVTNNGKDALLFQLGHQYTVGEDMLSTRIPAGQTVTRTFEMAEADAIVMPQFAVDVSTGGTDDKKVDISISAVQFSK